MSSRPAPPPPETEPETGKFWEAAKDGRLLVKRCGVCGEAHYPPRALCPFCHSADMNWEEASGKGSIYSLSVMRRSPNGPYAIAYVELDEGPRILTNILADDLDAVAIGDRVGVEFKPAEDDGRCLPYFRISGD